MSERNPLFSICIPAFNRARYLPPLLDSIVSQSCRDFEIVICEDVSPERPAISAIAGEYQAKHPDVSIRYFENEKNLGFDLNFKELLRRSSGAYCVILGNDDILLPGALAHYQSLIAEYPDAGMFVRSFISFIGSTEKPIQHHVFWTRVTEFPPGEQAIINLYPRIVAMAGLVLRRDICLQAETTQFDGTLFYQMYLALKILRDRSGVATPVCTVAVRKGELPEFGQNATESEFKPGYRGPEFDIALNRSIIGIAGKVLADEPRFFSALLSRLGRHSYSALAHQAHLPVRDFYAYYRNLGDLGLSKSLWYRAYFVVLAIFGEPLLARAIRLMRTARRRVSGLTEAAARG